MDLGGRDRGRIVRVDVAGLDVALRAAPVTLSTMGRGLDAHHAYFIAAATSATLSLSPRSIYRRR